MNTISFLVYFSAFQYPSFENILNRLSCDGTKYKNESYFLPQLRKKNTQYYMTDLKA